jgi:hypothetical protein
MIKRVVLVIATVAAIAVGYGYAHAYTCNTTCTGFGNFRTCTTNCF